MKFVVVNAVLPKMVAVSDCATRWISTSGQQHEKAEQHVLYKREKLNAAWDPMWRDEQQCSWYMMDAESITTLGKSDPGVTGATGNRKAEKASERPAEGAAERPAEVAAERPAEGAAERPAEGAAERPAVGAAENMNSRWLSW